MSIGAYSDSLQGVWILVAVLTALSGGVVGIYLLRGRGPSTQSVEARLAQERKQAKAKRRAANIAGFAAGVGGIFRPRVESVAGESAAVAQIKAVSNPETAQALQNLEKLLYTKAITDTEYQAAKDKLLGTVPGDDSFAQIRKLAELHEAGILGDIEFAAAKARALGI